MKPHQLIPLFLLFLQTVTEKHKLNVPETMNEVLDMSDDEGKQVSYDFGLFLSQSKFSFAHLHIISNIFHLNYTVRRANVPEMLNEDYISDVDEGISYFVWFVLIAPACCFLLIQSFFCYKFFSQHGYVLLALY